MKAFNVPTKEQVSPAAQTIFGQLESQLGKVPNLYATIGYSASALEAHLTNSATLGKGAFSTREREAIFLAVSEVNQCQYCLAAHTAIAQMNKYSELETQQLRAGTHPDAKLSGISRLAADIARTNGSPSQTLLDEFFGLGLDEGALVDLVALVTEISFTNYIHKITQVPVDFPTAKPLAELTHA